MVWHGIGGRSVCLYSDINSHTCSSTKLQTSLLIQPKSLFNSPWFLRGSSFTPYLWVWHLHVQVVIISCRLNAWWGIIDLHHDSVIHAQDIASKARVWGVCHQAWLDIASKAGVWGVCPDHD
jgi:hypothetical protein